MANRLNKFAYSIPYTKFYIPFSVAILFTLLTWIITISLHVSPYVSLIITIFVFIVTYDLGEYIVMHIILDKIFGPSLRIFLKGVKNMHPAIKSFTKLVLDRFIGSERKYLPELLNKQRSLLTLANDLNTTDVELPSPAYAVLLEGSIILKPKYSFATWIDSAIAVEGSVFLKIGNQVEINDKYIKYFDTLSNYYVNINHEDKHRIFVLTGKKFNDFIAKQTFFSNEYWKKCLELHKQWGFHNLSFIKQNILFNKIDDYTDLTDFVIFESTRFGNWAFGTITHEDNKIIKGMRKSRLLTDKNQLSNIKKILYDIIDDGSTLKLKLAYGDWKVV